MKGIVTTPQITEASHKHLTEPGLFRLPYQGPAQDRRSTAKSLARLGWAGLPGLEAQLHCSCVTGQVPYSLCALVSSSLKWGLKNILTCLLGLL